jgi:hypothetical protein
MPVKNNNRPDRGANKKAGNAPKLTAEEKRAQLAKQLKIRPATKDTVDMLLNNPKLSQTDAWLANHATENRDSASATASKVLAKPNEQIYKASAVGKAKKRIVQLVDSSNESIALKSSQDILDRTEGKAIQRNETTSRSVEVKLDLSGVRIGSHYIKSDSQPIIDVDTNVAQ